MEFESHKGVKLYDESQTRNDRTSLSIDDYIHFFKMKLEWNAFPLSLVFSLLRNLPFANFVIIS